MGSNFKNIIDEDKPRERFVQVGRENLSNEELISIILKTGTKDESVSDVSKNLLSMVDSITDLKDISINKLMNIKGIGLVKAIELLSAIELGKRIYYNNEFKRKIKIKNSLDAYNYIKNKFINKTKEYFYCIYLDSKSNIIEDKLLFIGGLNSCIIEVREIFKYAHLNSAASFICVHNHPSGDITPSKCDDANTINIIKVSRFQGIPIKDHIIVGNNKYYSYNENSDIVF